MLESHCKVRDSYTAVGIDCCAPATEVVMVACLVHKLQQIVISICIACIAAALNM